MKLVKLGLAALILPAVVACTHGKITVTKDTFKGITLIKMTNQYRGNHEDSSFFFNFALTEHTRKLKAGAYDGANLRFRVSGAAIKEAGPLDESAFLKIDGEQIEIKLTDRRGDSKTKTKTNTSQDTKDIGGGMARVTTKTETKSRTYVYALGTMEISEEVSGKLAKAKELTIAVYFNEQPVIFPITGGDLEKLREFFNHKGQK